MQQPMRMEHLRALCESKGTSRLKSDDGALRPPEDTIRSQIQIARDKRRQHSEIVRMNYRDPFLS